MGSLNQATNVVWFYLVPPARIVLAPLARGSMKVNQKITRLVPDKDVVRQRLRENLIENRILRRLLRISESIDQYQPEEPQLNTEDKKHVDR